MAYLGVREVESPEGSSQSVIVGGVEVAATSSEQAGGQDAPTAPVESGAEVTQRNVITPENGTITGWTDTQGLSSLYALYASREPISITTPEATVPLCVVEEISRTRDGQYVDAFQIDIEWRQILLGELGTATITAVTADGPKSPAAGSGPTSSEPSLVGGETKSTSGGPDAAPPAVVAAVENTPEPASASGSDDGGGWLDNIGSAIGDWL